MVQSFVFFSALHSPETTLLDKLCEWCSHMFLLGFSVEADVDRSLLVLCSSVVDITIYPVLYSTETRNIE